MKSLLLLILIPKAFCDFQASENFDLWNEWKPLPEENFVPDFYSDCDDPDDDDDVIGSSEPINKLCTDFASSESCSRGQDCRLVHALIPTLGNGSRTVFIHLKIQNNCSANNPIALGSYFYLAKTYLFQQLKH